MENPEQDAENHRRFVASVAGISFVLCIFVSPLSTMKRIVERRSTEHFSVVPYLATMLCCLISAWHGVLFSSPDNIPVPFMNGLGAVLQSAYVITFIIYARTRRDRVKFLLQLAVVIVLFTILALVPLLALDGDDRRNFCSMSTLAALLSLYASPLTSAVRAIRTTSMEFVPTNMFFCMCLYAKWISRFYLHANTTTVLVLLCFQWI